MAGPNRGAPFDGAMATECLAALEEADLWPPHVEDEEDSEIIPWEDLP